jgi:glycosyltransferase involved in cell wall biosynthesis
MRARKAFVCSEVDRRYLATWWRFPRVVTIPNAVAIPEEYGMDRTSRTLLFLATYAYAPNIAAAEFLISDVWPRVREACPEARLIIAGNLPERIPSFSKHPAGVEFTGFVEHLEPLYRRVRIVCCPVLSGGGTRLKILEAAAYGKAIVSTGIGAEGLDLRDGQEIMLRDGGPAYARACIELLNAPGQCERLGLAARGMVSRQYDRKQIVSRIKDEIRQRPTS